MTFSNNFFKISLDFTKYCNTKSESEIPPGVLSKNHSGIPSQISPAIPSGFLARNSFGNSSLQKKKIYGDFLRKPCNNFPSNFSRMPSKSSPLPQKSFRDWFFLWNYSRARLKFPLDIPSQYFPIILSYHLPQAPLEIYQKTLKRFYHFF